MPGPIRGVGSLGFNKFDRKRDLKDRYDSSALQQENINANTNNKMREPMRNLMFDPRVVRGSPFPHLKKPSEDPPIEKKTPTTGRPGILKKKAPRVSDEPAPVKGRKNCDIQTDQYLEEIIDEIPDFNAVTQTDPFLDRPATPLFIPWKSGPDKETQIYENDLFNFDLECEPLLEVLVGRSIEQAVMEVMEDHQLAHIRMHQDRFEQLRIAEMVSAEKLEAAHIRALEEAERRKEQERKRIAEEERLRDRVVAEVYARRYLHEMKEEVVEYLRKQGYFYDPVQREIELEFIPPMLEGVRGHLEDIMRSRFVLSYMVQEAMIPQEDVSLENASDGLEMILDGVNDMIEAGDNFGDAPTTVDTVRSGARQGLDGRLETVQQFQYSTTDVVRGLSNLATTTAASTHESAGRVLADLYSAAASGTATAQDKTGGILTHLTRDAGPTINNDEEW